MLAVHSVESMVGSMDELSAVSMVDWMDELLVSKRAGHWVDCLVENSVER